jgi:hypothetical protein
MSSSQDVFFEPRRRSYGKKMNSNSRTLPPPAAMMGTANLRVAPLPFLGLPQQHLHNNKGNLIKIVLMMKIMTAIIVFGHQPSPKHKHITTPTTSSG